MKEFVKKHRFLIGLFLFSFLLRLIVIFTIDTEITSDFKTMYDASLELLNGTTHYKNSIYFLTWGYQMGHVIYQSLLLSIINSVTFLKIINALVTSLTVVFIYLLGCKIATKKAAAIASILYSIFLFPLFLNTVLTNQLLPILLVLIALYLLSKLNYQNNIIIHSIIIGLLLGLSNILRSEAIVIIAAIFLYSIFLIMNKYSFKKVISSFLLICISYFSLFHITSFIFIKTDISPSGLHNMNPAWKFVLGFNYETNGMYSDTDASLYANNYELSKQVVKERVSEFNKIPLLFLKKIKIQWFNSDLSWSLNQQIDLHTYQRLNFINQLFIILFHFFAFLSIFSIMKKNFHPLQILITLILFAYFGAYLLIEIMPRYAYSMQVFEAILASVGINIFLKKINYFYKKILI